MTEHHTTTDTLTDEPAVDPKVLAAIPAAQRSAVRDNTSGLTAGELAADGPLLRLMGRQATNLPADAIPGTVVQARERLAEATDRLEALLDERGQALGRAKTKAVQYETAVRQAMKAGDPLPKRAPLVRDDEVRAEFAPLLAAAEALAHEAATDVERHARTAYRQWRTDLGAATAAARAEALRAVQTARLAADRYADLARQAVTLDADLAPVDHQLDAASVRGLARSAVEALGGTAALVAQHAAGIELQLQVDLDALDYDPNGPDVQWSGRTLRQQIPHLRDRMVAGAQQDYADMGVPAPEHLAGL